MKIKKLWTKFLKWKPRRVIIISVPLSDPQGIQQLADAFEQIKKDSQVIVVNGSNEIKIKKVWI